MAVDNRMSLRVPTHLKEWVKAYAEENHTTVSALVVRFLTRLQQEDERRKQQIDAEQV